MKTIIQFIYFFPLITWWFLVLLDMIKSKNKDNNSSTIIIALNVLSFIPILNWFVVIELYKIIIEQFKNIFDD